MVPTFYFLRSLLPGVPAAIIYLEVCYLPSSFTWVGVAYHLRRRLHRVLYYLLHCCTCLVHGLCGLCRQGRGRHAQVFTRTRRLCDPNQPASLPLFPFSLGRRVVSSLCTCHRVCHRVPSGVVVCFRIPADIEYTHDLLPSMSSEELEKLNAVRPETFAAASQMQGITPHSLVYLYNHVTRKSKVCALFFRVARGWCVRVRVCVCSKGFQGLF